MLHREAGYKKMSATYKIQKINVSPKRNIACKRNSSVFSCVLLVLIETSPVPYLVLPSQWVEIPFRRSFRSLLYFTSILSSSSCRIRHPEVKCVNENNSIQSQGNRWQNHHSISDHHQPIVLDKCNPNVNQSLCVPGTRYLFKV